MVKFPILGTTWKAYIHSDDTFCRRYGDEDAAFVIPDKYEIHFNAEDLSLVTVKHEIAHCYFAMMCTSSAMLTVDQVEEVFCELIGIHGDHMIRQSRALFKEMKEEKDHL